MLCWGAPGGTRGVPRKSPSAGSSRGRGGAADATARIIANAVSARWGQPIVIDNRPGATGTIANDATAKAKPDGYTLGQATMSTYVMSNHVRFPAFPTNPQKISPTSPSCAPAPTSRA